MNEACSISFAQIQAQAAALGWDDVGITSATISNEDREAYLDWLALDGHAKLGYMENQMRCNPQALFPGAKTALIFVSYYKQEFRPFKEGSGLIASYARGRDYHHLHRKRLKKMIAWMETETGQQGIAKGFSDSSPIMEKALAVQAGLGWFGKNTLLIHRRFGTFILLSGLLTTLSIPFAPPYLEIRLPRCGSCTRCLDACPTQAFRAPYQLDAGRCLSYHLIESREDLPEEIQKKNPGYAFGCDICQDVCPHNIRKPVSDCLNFKEEQGMGAYLNLMNLSHLEEHPENLFGTPLQRRGVEGLRHTLSTISNKGLIPNR